MILKFIRRRYTRITLRLIFFASLPIQFSSTSTGLEPKLSQPSGSLGPARSEEVTDLPRVFLLDPERLRVVRHRIREGDKGFAPASAELESDAKSALRAGPFSVVEKTNLQHYRELVSKLPPIDPSERANLLRPTSSKL